MASFDQFYPILEPNEGGYVSAATAASIGDSGGETYKGVARNYNPTWEGWKIIDAYKAANGGKIKHNAIIPDPVLNKMVKDLAKKKYWDVMRLDEVRNQSLANLIADFGFNSGTGAPAKAIQRILGLVQDGVIGPVTIKAINSANQKTLFEKLKEARINFINSSTKILDKIKPQLVERADSFFFREEK
ncbi:MAG: glycosyl hydrolase 108 family protein [Cytophagaceae bacterium]